MSVITNKDRISENNDKINRLIKLAKQKGLTSNPKPATTEDEMDAMITDKNVGKVVKYLGESGGKYEKDALYIIAEGDEIDSGLFARRLNITEGTLTITKNGTYDVMNKASVDVNTPVPEGTLVITENGTHDVSYKASVEVNVASGGGSVENKLALAFGKQSADNPYDITASDLEGVTEIRNSAFRECTALTSIDLSNVTSIGQNAFNGCTSLTSVSMPNVTSVGVSVFQNCYALTSANIPNVTSVGINAFRECIALTSIDLSNVTSVGGSAFQYCGALTSIDLSNVTSVDSFAFMGCSLSPSISMPNVISVGMSAFSDCDALTSAFIGSACTSIGNLAFNCGTSGFTVTIEATTPPTLGGTSVFKKVTNFKIIVPAGCGETYKTATNWTNFTDYIVEATE